MGVGIVKIIDAQERNFLPEFSDIQINGNKLTWKDPVSTNWDETKITIKKDDRPADGYDGLDIIVTNEKNKHRTEPLSLSGLEEGAAYYLGFSAKAEGDNFFDLKNVEFFVYTPVKTYGVVIDLTNSNPVSCIQPDGDAVGIPPGPGAWDETPLFKGIKPCLLKNGKVNYYLKWEDFTKKEDGTNADITSGNDGDVMIEIPKLGYKIDTVGDNLYVRVTTDLNKPEYRYYAHSRETEGDRDKIYVGAFLGSELSGKLRSLSGIMPKSSWTISQFRSAAQANGPGYQQLTFYVLTLLQCLYLIRYKNLNSQVALGKGYVEDNPDATKTGKTLQRGRDFGENTGKHQMKFLGIEDFWGNSMQWIDGLYYDNNKDILTSFKNFNDSGAGYVNRGKWDADGFGGWMSRPQGTSEKGFAYKSGDGSSTTFFCDRSLLSPSQLPAFGGNSAHGDTAGVFYMCTNSSSTFGLNLSGRLLYI